jgi:AraC family transcriptional regulator
MSGGCDWSARRMSCRRVIAVADIGREAGYGSQSAFTRAFGSRFGCAPRVFRERERGRWAGPVVEQRRLVGRIETVAPLRVAFVRHVGPYDQVRTSA